MSSKHPTPKFLAWQDYFVLTATIIVSVTLIFLRNENAAIGGIQGVVIETLALVQRPIVQLSRVPSLSQENQELRQSNADLVIENSRLKEAFLENQRLRKMLEFNSYHEFDCLPVKVMGRSGLESIRSVIVDAGGQDEVSNYMPIVSSDGLVGKIIKVNKSTSIGQILKDRNFRVGARIQRSRVEGIVKWAGDERCLLTEVPKWADVKIGDVVITSATSVLFFPGIKIGVVVDIKKQSGNLNQDVYLRPSVDFYKLEQVFVIRGKTETFSSGK